MSGAQAKAAVIAGAACIVAEVKRHMPLRRGHEQGWLTEPLTDDDRRGHRQDGRGS